MHNTKIILLLLTFLSTSYVVQSLKSKERQIALKTHNRYRRDLAKGEVVNKNGNPLPTAQNMYEFKYNIALEKLAEKSARKCEFKHSKPEERKFTGETIYTFTRPVKINNVLDNATTFWFQELADFGVDESLNLTRAEFDKGIGHFTQMAWGETTSVGCAVRYCKTKSGEFKHTIVFCNYAPPGNILNRQIYEIGQPCKMDSDCTRYKNSKCIRKRGLCRRN
ncbi:hypothetical protein M3Y94_00243600 [Aphelenchoides besseyi]|nr:hypothetical protein M3Y94_00243600 [Aphelenchoides besseyi]KAI6236326.1 SCP domain-containing protein [Aphelenchoides besseyi]